MDQIGWVRRLRCRDKKSEREIARQTSLSRNTVRKYLRMPLAGEPKYRRASAPTRLTPFHEALEQALKGDARLPRQKRRTALALYAAGASAAAHRRATPAGSPPRTQSACAAAAPAGTSAARPPRHAATSTPCCATGP
jgi:hypothetical protein